MFRRGNISKIFKLSLRKISYENSSGKLCLCFVSSLCVCVCNQLPWCVWVFATPRTAAHQGPLSREFSSQEYRSSLPFTTPGNLPNAGSNPHLWHLLHCQVDSLSLKKNCESDFISLTLNRILKNSLTLSVLMQRHV